MGTFLNYYNKQLEPVEAVPQDQQQQAYPVVDSANAIGSLAELLGPTPAEREAQERRMLQNRAKMQAWTGLFDGLRQLGNLYYATKGAAPQTFNNPYQLVDQEYQQQRNLYNDLANYRRQYNTSLYSLQKQLRDDARRDKLTDAQVNYYGTRDEMARQKAENDKLRAENDRLKAEAAVRTSDARTKNIESKTATEDALRPGRKTALEAQAEQRRASAHYSNTRAANVGGVKSGRNNGTYGYRTTKHIDPATGDVITERVPTTGAQPQKPQSKGSLLPAKKQQQQRRGSLLPK